MSRIRRAINFDLDTKALKEFSIQAKIIAQHTARLRILWKIMVLTMKSKLYKRIKNLKRLDDANCKW